MARPLRLEYPGALYHVTARGNARAAIARDDEDRRRFLALLARVVERFRWVCHAYCLMGNHYHLLIETPQANLSRGMRQLNGLYTQDFNRRHRQVGHLFQGRFKAIVVDKDSYLLELARYIVLNPVRAKMVKHPKDYRWSSYRATAGLGPASGGLTCDGVLGQFGRTRGRAEKAYREFVARAAGEPTPWDRLTGQIFLGPESFVKKLTRAVPASDTLREIPRQQRLAARPTLQALFPEHRFKHRAARDRAIRAAHAEHGYTLSEIGRALGLHYTTISKAVSRNETGK